MSVQNNSFLQQPPCPNPQSIHSDMSEDPSAQFSPSPPPSQQLRLSPHSHYQTHLHLEQDEQSAIPLLHSNTGLPVTVCIDESLQSLPTSHHFLDNQPDRQTHPDLIPIAQSSNTEQHRQQSPPIIVQNTTLLELPLNLLPQAEDEFDVERLGQIVERLRDANCRIPTSTEAPQHGETNEVLSPEDQDGAGPSIVVPKEEPVNWEENGEHGINGRENACQPKEEAIIQESNGDVSSPNPSNESHSPRATVKEEPVLIQLEDTDSDSQSSSTGQQIETGAHEGAHENVTAQASSVVDQDGIHDDPIPGQRHSDESSATGDQDQPRRRGRKRRRGDLETGYWLRSRKPPSSSKRSRRTNFWLRQ